MKKYLFIWLCGVFFLCVWGGLSWGTQALPCSVWASLGTGPSLELLHMGLVAHVRS